MSKLSHFDSRCRAAMVDISSKPSTRREAEASAFVVISPEVIRALPANPKGNPFEVARIAGISAAKRTAELIPLCHSLPLSHVDVRMELCENGVSIVATAATMPPTGVEMEALQAPRDAALTIHESCKPVDKSIEIRQVMLQRKSAIT